MKFYQMEVNRDGEMDDMATAIPSVSFVKPPLG